MIGHPKLLKNEQLQPATTNKFSLAYYLNHLQIFTLVYYSSIRLKLLYVKAYQL